MDYGKPQKLPDGRYFLKISGQRQQLNGVTLLDDLATKSLNISITGDHSAIFSKIDEEILGLLGASLATIKGEVVTLAFDRQKNPVELQEVKKDAQCDLVLELSGLWFLKKSFGPIWRVIQVRVRSGPAVPDFPKEYLFTDDPAPEDDPTDYVD